MVLGGNVFGWTADKETSFAILDRFADAGFEAIDTADVYSSWVPGQVESLIRSASLQLRQEELAELDRASAS